MTFEKEVHFFLSNSKVLITPNYDGVHASRIYTYNGTMDSKGTVDDIIRALCLEFGSTLKGRQKASRKMLGISKNPPIIISEKLEIVGMPLPYGYRGNAWVFDLDFKAYSKDTSCELRFKETLKIDINLSKDAVEARHGKALHLAYRNRAKNFQDNQQRKLY